MELDRLVLMGGGGGGEKGGLIWIAKNEVL